VKKGKKDSQSFSGFGDDRVRCISLQEAEEQVDGHSQVRARSFVQCVCGVCVCLASACECRY